MQAIYLDHAATTPMRAEVRQAMEPFLSDTFGNASSIHAYGRGARAALDGARDRLATALGVTPAEIFFVRGGTEANNLAVLGRAEVARSEGRKPLVARSTIEHSSVRDCAAAVEAMGGECLTVPVAPSGTLDPEALEEVWRRGAALLSLIWVNNEVGLIPPLQALAVEAATRGVPVHVDAVQAIGKIPVRLDRIPVTLATGSGHKIYGPKGTGFLFARRGTDVAPRIFGGGQERGLRPGTEDVAGAVGLATAVALAVEEQEVEAARLASLRDRLETRLVKGIPGARVHGVEGQRAPHILHVGIPGLEREALLMGLDLEGVAVSGGSACASGSSTTSPVLRALYGTFDRSGDGGTRPVLPAPLRFSLGRLTDEATIDDAAERTLRVVERLNRLAAR